MIIDGHRQRIIPLLISQHTSRFQVAVYPERSLNTRIRLAIDIEQRQALEHCPGKHDCDHSIRQNSYKVGPGTPFTGRVIGSVVLSRRVRIYPARGRGRWSWEGWAFMVARASPPAPSIRSNTREISFFRSYAAHQGYQHAGGH